MAGHEKKAESRTFQRQAPHRFSTKLERQNSISTNAVKRFLDYQIPAPGEGCHPAILGAANLGALAGIPPEQVAEHIRQSISKGKRHISDSEIQVAVDKAYSEAGKETGKAYVKIKTAIMDGSAALRNLIEQATIRDEAAICEASPVMTNWPHEEDAANFLERMFPPDVLLFIGDQYEHGIVGRNIRTAAEWVKFFRAGGKAGPFIIINPLNGTPKPKKSGDGETLRGDQNVKAFRHCLIEFYNLSREDQLAFWSIVKLPVKALVDTGGKSIHAWIDVSKLAEVQTADEWDKHIQQRLYDEILIPMGVDAACKNPARLSRLPGCFRPGKGKMQRLLWLSPEGRQVTR